MKQRLTLLAGCALLLAGAVFVVAEIAGGHDIWRRHSAIGMLVFGALLLRSWVAQR